MARLVRSADFERVLGLRSRARTPHFAVHHLPAPAAGRSVPAAELGRGKLSTELEECTEWPVDDSSFEFPKRLGVVVPKRHARRAVTRSLLRRQIYAAGGRHADALARGLWIVRLRAPFDRDRFVSAASSVLRELARAELDDLFRAVSRPASP
ncbi:MAG: ribonuclease P protein component [Caldimonas sp.]